MNSLIVLLSLTVPSPPFDVSVSQNGLGSLLVSWTQGQTTTTGYIIYYQQQDGGQRLSHLPRPTAMSALTLSLVNRSATDATDMV